MTNARNKGSRFIAVDPGPEQSALVHFDTASMTHSRALILDNYLALVEIRKSCKPIVVEMVASYGMPVGWDVFETVYWIGRFCEAAPIHYRVPRKDVKMHLCQSMRAKDANIRQALLDRYPKTGGGKTPQIGTKAQPGPLYGMKSHLWAALAVAVTFVEQERLAA